MQIREPNIFGNAPMDRHFEMICKSGHGRNLTISCNRLRNQTELGIGQRGQLVDVEESSWIVTWVRSQLRSVTNSMDVTSIMKA